jgi:carbon storage regulator CsrA
MDVNVMDRPTTLTLSRKPGETIHIGDDVTILVKRCAETGRVSLSITAPESTRILRGELKDRAAAPSVIDED